MTYGFLLFFAFVRTISYHNWIVYLELYYLQFLTIIAYHLNAHIMLLQYVICNYSWHMRSQNYELLCFKIYISSFLTAQKVCHQKTRTKLSSCWGTVRTVVPTVLTLFLHGTKRSWLASWRLYTERLLAQVFSSFTLCLLRIGKCQKTIIGYGHFFSFLPSLACPKCVCVCYSRTERGWC